MRYVDVMYSKDKHTCWSDENEFVRRALAGNCIFVGVTSSGNFFLTLVATRINLIRADIMVENFDSLVNFSSYAIIVENFVCIRMLHSWEMVSRVGNGYFVFLD